MATPNEKLAASLNQLRRLQRGGRRVFRSSELSRIHRERLLGNGFLLEVLKGWLISSNPNADPGDTTSWFATCWEFCEAYCTTRFGHDWYISPEQSVMIHAESTVIPRQIIIHSSKGTNNTLELPFGSSLFDLKQEVPPGDRDIVTRGGLRLLVPEAALVKIPATFYVRNPVEAQILLSEVGDGTDLLGRLLDRGHSAVAGRLAGAFRRIGRPAVADDMLTIMRNSGYDVRESDPFEPTHAFGTLNRSHEPITRRLQAQWESFRNPVISAFPKAPEIPLDPKAYLSHVDDIYRDDAYHSLSIEGYRVTPDLIERVRAGDWDPDANESDRQSRDVLGARGYWQTFQRVRDTVGEVVGGADAAVLVRTAHQDWYRELFQPGVAAGLFPASVLAGYRNEPVFLRGSRHVPPRSEAVRDAMPALFDLLEGETVPSVRAVLGHWMFGYIHPYPDGNGRLARFLMNAMLASGGYPWTIIRVQDRSAYLAALESASVEQDIEPFARFVAEQVARSMDQIGK